MRIEIFVVKTLNPNQNRLDKIKDALIRVFGGLTIIPNCEGLWLNEKGIICHDKVEIWLIYTDFKEQTIMKALEPYLTRIKAITKQTSQAYTLNSNLRLI